MKQQERVKIFNDFTAEFNQAEKAPRQYLHANKNIYEELNYDKLDIDDLNKNQTRICAASVAMLKALNCKPAEYEDKFNILDYYAYNDKDAGLSDDALEMIDYIKSIDIPSYFVDFIYAARGDWHAVYNYGANEYIPNDGKFPTGLDAVALNFEIYDEKTGELKFGLEQIENDMVSVLDD